MESTTLPKKLTNWPSGKNIIVRTILFYMVVGTRTNLLGPNRLLTCNLIKIRILSYRTQWLFFNDLPLAVLYTPRTGSETGERLIY